MKIFYLLLLLAIPVFAAPLPTLNPEKPLEETRLLREPEGELQLLEL